MGEERVLTDMRRWVEEVVVGLDLCPFAGDALRSGAVRMVVSEARDPESLRADLVTELRRLWRSSSEEVETTLLVLPEVLQDFDDFNQFLDVVDATLADESLVGGIQRASVHPHYRFAETEAADLGNYTNRSPHPTLHLLREQSVARAIESHPDPEGIPARNIETLERLGERDLGSILARCGVPGPWTGERRSGS